MSYCFGVGIYPGSSSFLRSEELNTKDCDDSLNILSSSASMN
jgi:hypothetical protein